MNSAPHAAARPAVGELAAIPTSTIAFGGISIVVSVGVFLGPYLETRRRNASMEAALRPKDQANAGYQVLRDAEQGRAYRIAALMTASLERATSIVEETFARTLQQWTRLPEEARVWFVLSTDVKLCLGNSFVGSLGRPVGAVPAVGQDDLLRAAQVLSVLEPTRRAIVILSRAENLQPAEVARVLGVDADGVSVEVDAALAQLGPVFGTVAA